jgi:[ribosomal protein S18]-alanine N-acetyltransferase
LVNSIDLPPSLTVGDDTFSLEWLGESNLEELIAIEQRSHCHPWSPQNFVSSLHSHTCIGLRHQQQCVGYAIFSFVVGEAELLLFVVDKPWQGRGVAKAFLQQVLNAVQVRARTVFLEVRLSNAVAIGLYESLGFNQVGIRPKYYPAANGRREDALLYALELI